MHSPRPTVSVITPAFNEERWLGRALASLRAQTFDDWECVLVDDGSTDRTLEVALSFDDPRIVPVRLGGNRGRAVARQTAFDLARGRFITMLDGDDWIFPHKLATQVDFLDQEPSVGIVATSMAVIDEWNRLMGIQGRAGVGVQVREPARRPDLVRFVHGPSMIRAHVIRPFTFQRSLRRSQDADLMTQLAMRHRSAFFEEAMYSYMNVRPKSARDVWRAYRYDARRSRRWLSSHPVQSAKHWVRQHAKGVVRGIAHGLGLGKRLSLARLAPVTPADRRSFLAAWEDVQPFLRPPTASSLVRRRDSERVPVLKVG